MADEFEGAGSVAVILPCCGGVRLIAIDAPCVLDAETREQIGDMVAEGCRVEHWTAEEVKTNGWKMGCQCKKSNQP